MLADKSAQAETRLRDAKTGEARNLAISSTLNAVGATLMLYGCPAALTGAGGVSCVGGLAVAGVGQLYSVLTTGGSVEIALDALNDTQELLEGHDSMPAAELDAALRSFETEFEALCSLVRQNCLR
ncbi:MAG: hypothetical protein KI788_05125 [Mameliella sp.]|nr:hypothetical protein [Mameliella sp.]